MKSAPAASAAALIWAMLTIEAPAQNLVAMIEDVQGTPPGVEFMDYVEAGKVIQLGAKDRIVLGYLKSCWRETITGGKVTVGAEWSNVEGGRVNRMQIACDAGKMQLTFELASKSGAKVFRDVNSAAPQQSRLAPLPKPQFTIYGLSPVVEIKQGSTVVIERVDKAGELHQVPSAGEKLTRGAFYDFADNKKALVPSGVYMATVGNAQCRSGKFLSRMNQM